LNLQEIEMMALEMAQGYLKSLRQAWVSFSLDVHLDDFLLERNRGFPFGTFGKAEERQHVIGA